MMERRAQGVDVSLQEIKDALLRMTQDAATNRNTNTIRFDAGGVGVWVCACLCCVMMTGLVMGGAWMSREFTRYDIALSERKEEGDRAQTYLSSIFGRMPQWMREEVEKEASAKLKEKEQKDAVR